MDRRNNQTNNLIKWCVIAVDILLLNGLLFFLKHVVPDLSGWAGNYANEFWIVCNLSMILAQVRYSTIIHLRPISGGHILRQVVSLTVMQTVIAYLIMKTVDIDIAVGWMLIKIGCLQIALLTILRFIERNAVKQLRSLGKNTRVITYAGIDSEIQNLHDKLTNDPTLGYRVRGYYADEKEADDNVQKMAEHMGVQRLGTLAELTEAAESNQSINLGDELYVCIPRSEQDAILALSHYCDTHFVRFYYLPPSSERLGIRFKRELLDDIELYSNHAMPLEGFINKSVKRAFDIVFSTVCLAACLPILPIVAVIIKVQSPGPIFFRQKRTGINGKSFMCYKFRSMHVNSDADTMQATKHDKRKFPFGSLMRKYNIDELPQFWNVLIGNMSVVGPRPHMELHTKTYSELIPKYLVRHFVKPGITGWSQVTGFRGETKELWQMEERVKRDIWYIENWTIWIDIRIMWMTLKSLFVHDKMAY